MTQLTQDACWQASGFTVEASGRASPIRRANYGPILVIF